MYHTHRKPKKAAVLPWRLIIDSSNMESRRATCSNLCIYRDHPHGSVPEPSFKHNTFGVGIADFRSGVQLEVQLEVIGSLQFNA